MAKIQLRPLAFVAPHFLNADGTAWLDTDEATKLPLTFQNDMLAFGDIEGKALNRSYPFTVPMSPKNMALLGYAYEPNTVQFHTTDKYFLATVMSDNGLFQIEGSIIITKTKKTPFGKGEYELLWLGKERFWIDILKETPLAALNYAPFDFQETTALALLQQTDPKHEIGSSSVQHHYWLAPIVNGKLKRQTWDNMETYRRWETSDLSILIFVGYFLELAQTLLVGWKFETSLWDNPTFKKSALHLLQNFRHTPEAVSRNQFTAGFLSGGLSQVLSTNPNFPTVSWQGAIPFQKESDAANIFNLSNKTFTSEHKGRYTFDFNVELEIKDVTQNETNSETINITLQITKSGTTPPYTHSVLAQPLPTSPNVYTFLHQKEGIEIDLDEGQAAILSINISISGVVIGRSYQIKFKDTTTLAVRLNEEIINDTIMPQNYIDPKITTWEMLNDIWKLFNCHYQTDYVTKTIRFEPHDIFYGQIADAKDLTPNVVASQSVSTTPPTMVRYANFYFANDDADLYYKNQATEPIYNHEHDFINENPTLATEGSLVVQLKHLAATANVRANRNVELPCCASVIITRGDIDGTMPRFYDLPPNTTRNYTFTPRIYYIEGWKTAPAPNIPEWQYFDTLFNAYPSLFFHDRTDTDGTKPSLSAAVLFNAYWLDSLRNYNFNGMVTLYITLSEMDILNLDLAQMVRINENYYYLKLVPHWLPDEPTLPIEATLLPFHPRKTLRVSGLGTFF
jgi:hypothetical protein